MTDIIDIVIDIILFQELPTCEETNPLREAVQKKNSGYNEFGTKGGRVSDLNHYLNNFEIVKRGGPIIKRNPKTAEN